MNEKLQLASGLKDHPVFDRPGGYVAPTGKAFTGSEDSKTSRSNSKISNKKVTRKPNPFVHENQT